MNEVLASALAREMPDVVEQPTAAQQRQLDRIIAAQGIVTETRDATLLWRFRHSLVTNRRAIVKFMESVRWHQPTDAERALSLLPRWAAIDVEEALPLLSSKFRHPTLRDFAVQALSRASDDAIMLYLIQLVQALRYEPSLRKLSGLGSMTDPGGATTDPQRLVEQAQAILASEGVAGQGQGQGQGLPMSGAGASPAGPVAA